MTLQHIRCKSTDGILFFYQSPYNDIHDHAVLDPLICNVDETSVQFVPTIAKTRAPQGMRRIKLIGIGKEKAQLTAIGASADGRMLPMSQLIFAGKKNRCHPNGGCASSL